MVMPRDERPPYVKFEVRTMEDRGLSIKQGHYVGRDVIFAVITPQGSKDRIERVADDWIAEKRLHVEDGRFPRVWYEAYRASYEAYKRDEEPPVDGTPLRSWPPISPTQYKALRELRILCVEDLAHANEETISRIGFGARALKDKATEWLKAASGLGMQVEEAERLRIDNESLRQTVASQQVALDEFRGQLQLLAQNQPGFVAGREEESLNL